MPYTVNGIGTWYYGKRGRMRRTDTCQSCNRVTTLESYETREFFVVLFIPIIPLRRFKILNSCTACSQHHRIPARQFQEMFEVEVAQAREAVEARPGDIDALENLCGVMLAYHQPEGARKAYQVLVEKCPDRATAHYGLAAAWQGLGRTDEAAAAFETALRLEPTLVPAAIDYSNMLWGRKRKQESVQVLQTRARANWNDAQFMAALYDHATWAKDWPLAANAAGRLLELSPELRQNKGFMRQVQKAHKKAGVPLAEPTA
jgi:tetratricopeptide (TPR) repeat protein